MSFWNAVYKFAWVLLLAGCAVIVVLAFSPRCLDLRALQRKKATLEDENHMTRAAILDLKQKQQDFVSDPAFVVRTAREIGMVKSNETLVKVQKDPAAPGTAAALSVPP